MRFRRWPLFHGRRMRHHENWTKAAKKGRIQNSNSKTIFIRSMRNSRRRRPRDQERENKTSQVSCAARAQWTKKKRECIHRVTCVCMQIVNASLSLSFCVCLRRCCCANTWPEQHTRRRSCAQNWAAWERKGNKSSARTTLPQILYCYGGGERGKIRDVIRNI